MSNVLTINPMVSLGSLTLHSKYSEIFSELRVNSALYSYIDMVFDPAPFAPLWLISQREGIYLRFNGESQRLELIEIDFDQAKSSAKKTTITLKSKNLRQLEYQYGLSYDFISTLMGPTFPLQYSKDSKVGEQRYLEGISFVYSVKPKSDVSKDMQIKKIRIYSQSNIKLALSNYKLYYPVFQIIINEGIQFICKEYSDWLKLGDSLDRALYVLKNPQKRYTQKVEVTNNPLPLSINNSYVLNYFSYGLDVILDGNTHKITKFIIHNNDPFHPQFNDYDRCTYFMLLNKEQPVDIKVNLKGVNTQVEFTDLSFYYQNTEYGVSFLDPIENSISNTSMLNPNKTNKICRSIITDLVSSLFPVSESIINSKNSYMAKKELYNVAKTARDCIDSGKYITNKSSGEEVKALLGIDDCNGENCFEKNWATYKTKTAYYGTDGVVVETTARGGVNSITLYKY